MDLIIKDLEKIIDNKNTIFINYDFTILNSLVNNKSYFILFDDIIFDNLIDFYKNFENNFIFIYGNIKDTFNHFVKNANETSYDILIINCITKEFCYLEAMKDFKIYLLYTPDSIDKDINLNLLAVDNNICLAELI